MKKIITISILMATLIGCAQMPKTERAHAEPTVVSDQQLAEVRGTANAETIKRMKQEAIYGPATVPSFPGWMGIF